MNPVALIMLVLTPDKECGNASIIGSLGPKILDPR